MKQHHNAYLAYIRSLCRLLLGSYDLIGSYQSLIWFWASTSFSSHLRCASHVSFPTSDGRGYLVVCFQALHSTGIVFVGICGVLVLVMALPTPEWVVVAAYLVADRKVGVGIPMSLLPTLALGIVHHQALSLAMSLVWLGVRGIDENEL